MRIFSAVFAAITISAGALAAGQAMAQVEVAPPIELPGAVSRADVVAACTAADATDAVCQATIHAYFAYLNSVGVTGADLEAEIAALTVALAQTDLPPGTVAVVVAALNLIATTYATGEQAAAILVIADTLAAGGEVETGALIASPA